jgi:glutaminyl-tRNA synthetase
VATETEPTKNDFIRTLIVADLASGKHENVVTRFPPEPNGYLHIGHAKAICLNFGIAAENAGARCHLRFDDTNPTAEDVEYVDSIQADLRWLGFEWGDDLYYASDYYERLYGFAVELIKKGDAFVCDLNAAEMREYRGTLTAPGTNSPSRDRSVEENLDLFERMRAGEFEEGTRTLRAKIDMTSPTIVLRDPVLYRIQRAHHHRTGDDWCIYPMYDFAHPLSDAIEGITHSLCTLEFADNRKFYDWLLHHVDAPSQPRQTEFARLNLTYTVLSKRILRRLVEDSHVTGWDDPRMPTIAGMRRRGYTPASIRNFCRDIGVARSNNLVQIAQLEASLREDLNKSAPRVLAVMRPLRVVIENFPDGETDELDAVNNPEDASAGTRKLPFSKVIYIERDDFMEDPPRKYFRLAPGREVRLRYAYFITCTDVIKDDAGEIVELRCTYDPATRGGDSPDGRKVKGTLHWVSAEHAMDAEVRLYDALFTKEDPTDTAEGEDFTANLNPASLEIVRDCKVEPGLVKAVAGERYQFERLGYFCVDPDSAPGAPVFNRTVGLKDAWARAQKAKK